MEASTSNGPDDVKTFRGRSLEELLPQIRAELGPDAIVLRRREGLGGGVGGFFQRPYVEVDARAPHGRRAPAGDPHATARPPRACRSPAVQALFEQATPFADALAAAARDARRMEDDTFSATLRAAADPTPQPEPEPDAACRAAAVRAAAPRPPASTARSRTPRRSRDAAPSPPRRSPSRPEPEPEPEPEPRAEPEAEPELEPRPTPDDAPPSPPRRRARRPATARPPPADAAEQRLVAAGLSPALAADVVGEAVVARPAVRRRRATSRSSCAPRSPAASRSPRSGPAPRTIAFVGGGGAGKSSAVAHLAAAYAAAGADVAVVALRGDGALADRLQPLGVGVIAADDAAQAERAPRRARTPLLTLIDTPAAGPEPRRPRTSRRWPPT